MRTEADLHRLRIFINESDRLDGKPLYEALVRAARDHGLAGATAIRGIEGFGASKRVHTVKVLRLSEDLPIIVEIVDQPDRVASFLPLLTEMVAEGMTTIERVRTIVFRRDGGAMVSDEELQLESSEFIPATQPSAGERTASTDQAQQVLKSAKRAAVESKRVFADSVDILLAMLCDSKGIARRALKELGIDCSLVEKNLNEEVSRDEPTKSFMVRLEKRSQAAAKWLSDDAIGTEHLLLALCEIRPSTATDTLMRLGVQPRDVCREVLIIHGHENDWQRWMADHPEM